MKNLLFSLCAVTPLLVQSSNRGVQFESEDCVDPSYSIVLEMQEENSDDAEQEPLSLEAVDLADVQTQKESKENLKEALIQLDAQMEQKSEKNLADGQGQQSYQEVSSKDRMCSDEMMCMPDIEPHQVNVRHTERRGIGYSRGYTTLEGLFTLSRGKYIPFVDLRGHVFDNGRLAANAGIGTRYVLNPSKSMVGINTFYDYRSLKHAHFNQWGVGLEGFYDRWELRINGYLPVGTKRIVADHHLNGISFKNFQGNNLWINENYTDKVISAKKGFDLEAGVHPFKVMRDYDCIVSAGPYYFGGEGESGWGGKVRLKVEVAKYLFVELSDSYDTVFHNRFQGTLMLSLPFGGKKCFPKKTPNAAANDCFANNIMAWRGVQPVQRQEIIVTKKQTKSYTIDPIAINPATNTPIVITFVNNQATSAGDGTFENPFGTLANARANTGTGSVIYVFAGDGTSTGYTTGWILQDGQRFLGSAAAHAFSTTKGIVTVPMQTNIFPVLLSSGGTTPAIQTPVGGVITTSNEISGISLQQSNGVCVSVATQNLTLTNNLFFGNSGDNRPYVNILSSGNALIDSNIFTNKSNNVALVFQKDVLSPTVTTVNAVISNNLFTNLVVALDISSTNATGILNATVVNNVISDCTNSGMRLRFTSGSVTPHITVNSNTISNITHVTNAGIFITQTTAGTGSYEIFDNSLSNISGTNGNMMFNAGTAGQNLCLNVHDNLSVLNTGTPNFFGYNFASTGGSIFAEPFVNNIGTVSGAPIAVPPCFCQFCVLPNTD